MIQINTFITRNTITHKSYLYINSLPIIHFTVVLLYIYCIVAVFYYVVVYLLNDVV